MIDHGLVIETGCASTLQITVRHFLQPLHRQVCAHFNESCADYTIFCTLLKDRRPGEGYIEQKWRHRKGLQPSNTVLGSHQQTMWNLGHLRTEMSVMSWVLKLNLLNINVSQSRR